MDIILIEEDRTHDKQPQQVIKLWTTMELCKWAKSQAIESNNWELLQPILSETAVRLYTV